MALNWLDALKLGGGSATGYASAQAQSRAAAMEAAMAREELRQTGEKSYNDAISTRERDRQDSAASAYKRLLQYDHVNSGGSRPPMVSPYSVAVPGPGANAQRLANDEGIVNELHQRASFGDPYFPGAPGLSDSNLNRMRVPGSDNLGDVYGSLRLQDAGKGEKIAGWLGTILPFLGGLFGGRGTSTTAPDPAKATVANEGAAEKKQNNAK
jgi:hypothetical protein